MRKDLQDILDLQSVRARKVWGWRPQVIKAIEEFAELTVVLAKKCNGSPWTPEELIDELADAAIVLRQMTTLFDGTLVDKVNDRIGYKLERLQRALDNAEGKKQDGTETKDGEGNPGTGPTLRSVPGADRTPES